MLKQSSVSVNTMLCLILCLILVACNGGPSPLAPGGSTTITLPSYMRQGYETYHETGGVARPANAIDVFIVYSPESQTYMPAVIQAFNTASAAGTNPVTGQPWGANERPIFVAGQDPTTGSSGTIAQGVINAIIAPNNETVYHPTILQPSVSHWLALVNFNVGRPIFDLANIQPTALSPVIIGIWESRAQAIQEKIGSDQIGWDDLLAVLESPNGWCDYGLPDCRRAVYYGHTDPTVSSTGLSTTISEFYACARQNGFTERELTLAAVRSDAVQDCVRDIEELVRHYSRRTEDFLEYIARGPNYLDFVALEETDLICLNLGAQQGDETCNKPQEKLVAIYPAEGTFWHEHPFGIVNADWVTAEQKAAAQVFTQFILTAPMQQLVMQQGFRPANSSVPLAYPFVAENGVDPAQPTTILDVPPPDVIVEIQQSWALVKKQADVVILIDISGSMLDEDKIGQAKLAAKAFLDEMEAGNRVSLVTFSDEVITRVALGSLETVRVDIDRTVDNLRADGGTALFDALYEVVTELNQQDSDNRIRAVVLLSDGADTASDEHQINDVLRAIEGSRDEVNPVLVIPVAYGSNADVQALTSIARASATTVQSGDAASILRVLQIIGSYF